MNIAGISNWALDPAKMNRGLYVTRQVPDSHELNKTAESICGKEKEQVYFNIYDFDGYFIPGHTTIHKYLCIFIFNYFVPTYL